MGGKVHGPSLVRAASRFFQKLFINLFSPFFVDEATDPL